MRILTVVGARPQFIKAAAVSRKLRIKHSEILVHTGQHYDKNMSEIFFDELNIPKPDFNLGVGSGSHGKQTGEMLAKIEELILSERPDMVLVYGDTNSTLAGALAASKLHIPVAHVEAGLRSYNMLMPEEQNRVLTDHISSLLLCPTYTAVSNLKKEGIEKGVYNAGDVMYDSVVYNAGIAEKKIGFEGCIQSLTICRDIKSSPVSIKQELKKKQYFLSTIHRAENTDNLDKLEVIIKSLNKIGYPVVFPVHPRIRKYVDQIINQSGMKPTNILFIEPVGYLQMLMLISNAQKVVTDSGGLQKEAYFLRTPCITLREQTEWVETLNGGWNVLCHIDMDMILKCTADIFDSENASQGKYFGDGNASSGIVDIITNFCSK